MKATEVGVFDSGVGGLSVLREIRALLPSVDLAYVADSKFVPYGTRSRELIRHRATAISRFLAEQRQARVIVVACNTATTHAVDLLREQFPSIPIVGMEPAIKPAARATRSGVVGILATGATLQGERVAGLIERHAGGIKVLTQPCPGLVEQVEQGDLSGPQTVALLTRYTDPLLALGADTIVLGCTHYPFLREALTRVVGPSVELVDSGAAVARQTAKVLPVPADAHEGRLAFLSSGVPAEVHPVMEQLWGQRIAEVEQLPV